MPEIPRYLPIKVTGPDNQIGKADPARDCGGTTWEKSVPKEGMTDLKSRPEKGFSCPLFGGAIMRIIDGKNDHKSKLICGINTAEALGKIADIIDEVPSMCPLKLAVVENLSKN